MGEPNDSTELTFFDSFIQKTKSPFIDTWVGGGVSCSEDWEFVKKKRKLTQRVS